MVENQLKVIKISRFSRFSRLENQLKVIKISRFSRFSRQTGEGRKKVRGKSVDIVWKFVEKSVSLQPKAIYNGM